MPPRSRRRDDGTVRDSTRFNQNPYASVPADNAGGGENAEAGPSGSNELTPPAEEEEEEARPTKRARAASIDSDDLDADGPESAAANEEPSPAKRGPQVRPQPLKGIGEFMNCGECGKKFTVTAYTKEHPQHKQTWLCFTCCPKLGIDAYAKAKKPRKAPAKKDARQKIVHYEVVKGAPALADLCIGIIGKYIEEVDALGDIGTINLDKVCKIICKSRRLTPDTAKLLYSVDRTELAIYKAMARLCPHLESLRLLYCGQMQTDTLKDWAESMRDLRELELYAPFLVRQEGWEAFFRARGPQLEKFLLTQSPRFDEDTLDVLVSSAPNLKALRLSEIGKLNSEWLPTIAKLKNLEYLDLSSPGTPLSDDAVAELLSAVGGKLTELDLSSNPELSDEVLDAIAKYCPRLTHLSLHHVDLSDEGLVRFFRALKAKKRPGLIELDLEKGHDLQSLDDLIAHSGQTLKTLSLCGWRGAEREQLSRLEECKNLEFLDISWCRNTNDFTVKDILDGCDAIKEVRVWGCNLLTDNVPRKKGVRVVGVETHAI
ncbi:DNA dependent ATPase [Trichosporon asahii var. asahii CBS 2479]|uniref:DNA dependent ATPase n=1 Tax=Trichosporon asahii var. asahii (strain ATCC 90039 / CBS 2479 / JCM 2466 / KCTC 7840 / NBRC 103889/ NCYC 2677 / UAMH 7654) TaxID=1186058 RepID=J6ELM7_TRIAS|nr:DNA dependent ATPase [Trichosporon asahii var. asahii CBS 2479]EJT45194.1 DNA dependent ATPase [Trichosporon asahii var. asahii CBS 2479]